MIVAYGKAGPNQRGVRVELQRGQSPLPAWKFSPSEAEEHVLVGSAPDCDWRVTTANVAAHHLELLWVEATLWVCAAEGQVWLDGSPVDAWTAVECDTTIFFGEAELCVFGAAAMIEADTVISSVDELSAAAAAFDVEPPEADEITAQIAPPAPAAARAIGREAWPTPRPQPIAKEHGVIAPTTTAVDELPPTGAAANPAAAKPAENTVFTDLQSLQRWADSCIEEPQPGAAPPQPAPQPAPATTANPLRVVESLDRVSTLPAPAQQPIAIDGLAAPPPSVDNKPAAPPQPPLMSRVIEFGQRVYEVIPTRVALGALAAILIIASLLVLDRINSKPQRRAHAAEAPIAEPVVETIGESAQLVRNTTPELDPDERAREEARAARLVAAGHLDEALPVYQQLAAADPANEAYAIAAKVLRQQLAARCQPGDKTCER